MDVRLRPRFGLRHWTMGIRLMSDSRADDMTLKYEYCYDFINGNPPRPKSG